MSGRIPGVSKKNRYLHANIIAATALLGALLGGCATIPQSDRTGPGPVTLIVENGGWDDVAIHLVGKGPARRLGVVGSMRRAEFAIPRAYVVGASDITVSASLIGSSADYLSPPILVRPGSIVRLQVAKTIGFSTFAVRESDTL